MHLNDENMYEHSIHMMEFNADFMQVLKKYQRLPMDSIDQQMQTLKELEESKENLTAKDEELEQLKKSKDEELEQLKTR